MAEEEVKTEEPIAEESIKADVESIPMGGYLPKMAEIVFARTFRWTLHPADSDDVSMWFTKVNYDLVNKKLYASIMENGRHDAFSWLRKASTHSSEATLVMYDGCGVTLHSIIFSGMKMVKHNCPLDYSNSEVVTHEVEFEFNSVRAYK